MYELTCNRKLLQILLKIRQLEERLPFFILKKKRNVLEM